MEIRLRSLELQGPRIELSAWARYVASLEEVRLNSRFPSSTLLPFLLGGLLIKPEY